MKIIHTADLHIGQQLHGFDRHDEHEAMLRALIEAAASNKVDAVLICGDVFDSPRPSSQSAALFSGAMSRLRNALPDAAIIVIAGNHDSGAFIDSHAPIYQELGIFLRGNLRPVTPDHHVITIKGKGSVVALPYTYSPMIPAGFNQAVISLAAEKMPGMPVVVAAHTTVLGSDPTGHPAPAMGRFDIGNIEGIEASEFGNDFDYLALGHIHRPQHPGDSLKVRYSGSPLPVSFDERFAHSFTLVDITERGTLPVVTEIPFISPRPILNIPPHGFGEWEQVKDAFSRLDPDFPGYVRLNVTVDGFLPPEARNEADRIASGKKCRFCLVNSRRRESAETVAGERSLSVEEFRELPVIEIARRYARGTGANLDEELLSEILNSLRQS